MKFEGWLLEPFIKGKYAELWFKTIDDKIVHLRDRYHPFFIVEPNEGFTAKTVSYLFEEHPDVHSTSIVERYATLHRRKLKKVVEVKVDSATDLEKVIQSADKLPEIKEIYNTGLIPIQWYLIYKDLSPTSLCYVEETKGKLKKIIVLHDENVVEPPRFNTLIFSISDSPTIDWIKTYNEEKNPLFHFEGNEAQILNDFRDFLQEEDPDIIVTDRPISTTKKIIDRATCNAVNFRFGRKNELYHGRVLLSLSTFNNVGICGLVERTRFTLAPMGVIADWEPGKTIDSRQCYEAVKSRILVPKMKGGFGFSSTAWDVVKNDRGGIVFSPQIGLHENVGCLDFESMFPNIIVHKNVSYETVDGNDVNTELKGFMGRFTDNFLNRRLWFKHLRKFLPVGSREWLWCQQRQKSLKLMLVVVYGYSGCYANRYANVKVFQEINRLGRKAMVQALNVSIKKGFTVIYGDTDSIFLKKEGASKKEYVELAKEISGVTGLPMGLDRHFKYIVLLSKVTDPTMVATRRYYGKLTDGTLYYRGIELRRHDTPPLIKKMQLRMIETLFNAKESKLVFKRQLPKTLEIANKAYFKVLRGEVDPKELVISKKLRRDLKEYKAFQPHVVAAMLGDYDEDEANYILVNTERKNPFLRVMPFSMLNGAHKRFDRKKYASLVRRAAWNLLNPFIPSEDFIRKRFLKSKLDVYCERTSCHNLN